MRARERSALGDEVGAEGRGVEGAADDLLDGAVVQVDARAEDGRHELCREAGSARLEVCEPARTKRKSGRRRGQLTVGAVGESDAGGS